MPKQSKKKKQRAFKKVLVLCLARFINQKMYVATVINLTENPQWVSYKAKRILYVDLRSSTIEEGRKILNQAAKIIEAENEKILMLTDIRDFVITSEFLQEAKAISTRLSFKIDKHAMLGITGPKRVIIRLVNFLTGDSAVACQTEEAAKEYLIA